MFSLALFGWLVMHVARWAADVELLIFAGGCVPGCDEGDIHGVFFPRKAYSSTFKLFASSDVGNVEK
jgi:hypothetical protein